MKAEVEEYLKIFSFQPTLSLMYHHCTAWVCIQVVFHLNLKKLALILHFPVEFAASAALSSALAHQEANSCMWWLWIAMQEKNIQSFRTSELITRSLASKKTLSQAVKFCKRSPVVFSYCSVTRRSHVFLWWSTLFIFKCLTHHH